MKSINFWKNCKNRWAFYVIWALMVLIFSQKILKAQQGFSNENTISTGEIVHKKLSENINIVKKGDKYSIELRNADLGDVIRFFAYKYNLNIIADKDVKGTVTASLSNISIKEALRQILDSQGYAMTEVDNVIRVKKKPTPTKHFKLKNISVNDVKESLTSLLSSNGRLILDENSNSIMVTDDEDHLHVIENFINNIDVKGKQVFIEAKFLETTVENIENLGIEWSIIASATGAERPHTFPFRKTGAKSFFPDVGTSAGFSSKTGWPTLTTGYSSGTYWTLGTLDFTQTQTILRALLSDSKTKIISNPQVIALNNQEAKISISTEHPLPTYEINSDTGELTVSGYEYKEIGIILDVTPVITEDNYVTMTIEPEVGSSEDSVTIYGTEGRIIGELPIITSKKATTKVTVKDGQTIVIGGLISEDDSNTVKKVPLLGSIPLLGQLFTYKSKSKDKTELLIFVTPHIISPEGEKETEKGEKEKKISRLYKKVEELQNEGNYEEAVLKLEEILKIEPEEEKARQMLTEVEEKIAEKKRRERIEKELAEARDLYQQGKYEQAERLFTVVLQQDTSNSEAQKYLQLIKEKREEEALIRNLWKEANDLLRANKYKQAKDKFLELKKLRSDDKKIDRMIKICEKKIEIQRREHIQDLVKRGKEYYRDEDYKSALELFNEVLNLDPENKIARDYVNKIAKIKEERLRKIVTDKEKAIHEQEFVSEEVEEKITVLLEEAISAYEGGDLDYARSLCDLVLKLAPDNETAQQYLERIEEKKKTSTISEIKFEENHITRRPEEEAGETPQKVRELFETGVQKFKQKDYQAAIGLFEKVLLEEPDNEEAYRYLEKCHLELMKIKEKEKSEKISSLIEEGRGFIRDGQYEQAFESFYNVLEIDPGNKTAQRYLKYLEDKVSRVKSRQAQDIISQLARKQDQWVSAELERADIYIQEGNYQQAKEILKNILDVKKSDKALELLNRIEMEQKKQLKEAEQQKSQARIVYKGKIKEEKMAEIKRLYGEGIELYKRGEYKAALEKFTQILNSGLDYKRDRIEKLSAICLEKLQEAKRDELVERKYQLALRYFDMALYDQAIKLLLEVIDIKPNYKEADKYLKMATKRMDILEKLGEYEQSEVEVQN